MTEREFRCLVLKALRAVVLLMLYGDDPATAGEANALAKEIADRIAD